MFLKNGAPKLPFFSFERLPCREQAQTSTAPGFAGFPPTPRDANLASPLEFQGGKGGLISLLDNLKTRLCIEKAKPSTVAAAIPGSSPSFWPHKMEENHK